MLLGSFCHLLLLSAGKDSEEVKDPTWTFCSSVCSVSNSLSYFGHISGLLWDITPCFLHLCLPVTQCAVRLSMQGSMLCETFSIAYKRKNYISGHIDTCCSYFSQQNGKELSPALLFSSARVKSSTSRDTFDELILLPMKCSKESSEGNPALRFPLFLATVFKILPPNVGKTTNGLQDSSWFHLRAMPWAAVTY